MRVGIVSCQVFYQEILSIAQTEKIEVEVEFLPQGLHDYPNRSKMGEEIQRGIDMLEERGDFDYLLLGYGFCGGGVEGIKSKSGTLLLPLVHDCIPLLLGERDLEGVDTSRTYFLSRGWIDCGGDCYKEHRFMIGEIERMKENFSAYAQKEGALVDWFTKERYMKRDGVVFKEEMATYVSFECMKNYHTIALIDNGFLTPFHYKYAREMHQFVDGIVRKYGDHGVDFKVMKGDTSLLKDLFLLRREDFLCTPPGEPLSLKGYL